MSEHAPTDTTTDAVAAPTQDERPAVIPRSRIGLLLSALGGVCLWLSGRMVWVHADVVDDKADVAARTIDGATWAPLIAPGALILLAGVVALLVTRGWVARMVALVMAAVTVATSYPVTMTLINGADPEHAEQLLQSQSASTAALAPHAINSWAEVTSATISMLPVVLAFVGVVLGIIGAVQMWLRPGWKPAGDDAYDTAAQRRERLAAGESAAEDLGDKDLWDSLDAGNDPTDRAARG